MQDSQIHMWNESQDGSVSPSTPATPLSEEDYSPPSPTVSLDPCKVCNLDVPQPSGLPFATRHAFLKWLNPLLESLYYAAALRIGRPVSTNLCLWEWNKAIENGEINIDAAYTRESAPRRRYIRCGAASCRHDYLHKRDIAIVHLKNAMDLPTILGYPEQQEQVDTAYELLLAASQPDADQATIKDFYEAVAIAPPVLNKGVTSLCSALHPLNERAFFRYTKTNNPGHLRFKNWILPEQVEIWDWCSHYKPTGGVVTGAVHNSYDGENQSWVSGCAYKAKALRNDADHRHEDRTTEHVLEHVHSTIMCLNVLGDYEAALEAEILGERWMTQTSRAEVLQRLCHATLEKDFEGIEDPRTQRRERRRWVALTEMMGLAPLASAQSHDTSSHNPAVCDPLSATETETCLPSSPSIQKPTLITLTYPDSWDFRRQTFYLSMHPALKVLPEPEEEDLWTAGDDVRELELAQANTDWEDSVKDCKWGEVQSITCIQADEAEPDMACEDDNDEGQDANEDQWSSEESNLTSEASDDEDLAGYNSATTLDDEETAETAEKCEAAIWGNCNAPEARAPSEGQANAWETERSEAAWALNTQGHW